jgi:uncharacterized membrane protein YeaQ/YmgE (transglycosylase-associated protein family)
MGVAVFYLWFLIGILVGWGARMFLPERLRMGVFLEMTLGMVGAFAGGLAAAAFLGSWADLGAWTLVGALLGAIGMSTGTGVFLREEDAPGNLSPD